MGEEVAYTVELTGQKLCRLQERLCKIEYIRIDEYSMLGQVTVGWIDRRLKQATGHYDKFLGGKSVILTGDSGQLPSVRDKPLYHSKPTNSISKLCSTCFTETGVISWRRLSKNYLQQNSW